MTTLFITQNAIDALILPNANLVVTQVSVDVLVTVAESTGEVNFPNSPSLNDIHTYTKDGTTDVRQWQWNGVSWRSLGRS